MMPPIIPTLVGAAFAHEPAIGEDADATVEIVIEPKFKITTPNKSVSEFLRTLTVPLQMIPQTRRGRRKTPDTVQHPRPLRRIQNIPEVSKVNSLIENFPAIQGASP
jgi:predicted nucleic acid-binding protein